MIDNTVLSHHFTVLKSTFRFCFLSVFLGIITNKESNNLKAPFTCPMMEKFHLTQQKGGHAIGSQVKHKKSNMKVNTIVA